MPRAPRLHTAQVLDHLCADLDDEQRRRATDLLLGYLEESDDWIVLNTSIGILAEWAQADPALARSLTPLLERHATDRRKSVAKRAAKSLESLGSRP